MLGIKNILIYLLVDSCYRGRKSGHTPCYVRARHTLASGGVSETTATMEGNMKHRILIADDDESARSGLADLLSTWGYQVEEAIDGKDALERAPAFGPSVVIADLVMPGLDG